MNKIVKVGVGVIIKKGNKILLGKRKNAHGEGKWSFPGGHLEFSEEIESCANREVLEEVGIKIKNLKISTLTNDYMETENKHYITIFVISDFDKGEIKVMEPNKCEIWDWFEWENMPKPLFLPIENLLKQKFNPFK